MTRRHDLPFSTRLALSRALVNRRTAMRDAAPVWLQDQVDAAGDEVGRFVIESGAMCAELEPARGWQSYAVPGYEAMGLERVAYLYAAALGCHQCIHLLRSGPQPAIADLNHHLVLCRRCARTWRKPIDDSRCEVCGELAGPRFTPFLVQLGALCVGGNAGDCCAALVVPEVAA